VPRHFPNWLAAYSDYTQYSESPNQFHFWTGVATIAGSLRRRVWIDEMYFQWTPNFYIVLVGPPGVAAKSTSIGTGFALLDKVKGVKFGPNSMTWQALTFALSEAGESMKLGELYYPMSCITCSVKELGTFLRPDDGELIDVLTDLWDGQLGTWRRDTKSEGQQEIENPWINVIGCTTPAWLQANFKESMIGGGLTSRIVFVYGDKKRRLVPYPSLAIDKEWFAKQKTLLIEDLNEIAKMKGPYELTPEARAWGVAWYEQHWSTRPQHMASERYKGYIARKQTHIHKLAIVVAAAQRDELTITEPDLETCHMIMTELEDDMQKVFESLGGGDASSNVRELLAYVRAYGGIRKSDLWRHCMPLMDYRAFGEACEAALQAKFMTVEPDGGTVMYKPTKTKA